MTCNNCGYTQTPVYKRTYKGILDGIRKRKTIKICACCSAWGIEDDEEKIRELTGFDELLDFS